MPKPTKDIHAKDKPLYLQNQRKHEMNRNQQNISFRLLQHDPSIEMNACGMMFFLLFNAELLKFGSGINTSHAQYGKNSQLFSLNDNKASVKFHQKNTMKVSSFRK